MRWWAVLLLLCAGPLAASETIVDKLAVHDKPGAIDKLMAH